MKIDAYNIQQSSSHNIKKTRSETENLEVWTGWPQEAEHETSYVVDINSDHFSLAAQKACLTADAKNHEEHVTDTRIKLLEAFVYQLTGKRIKFQVKMPKINASDASSFTLAVKPAGADQGSGWGLVYEYQEIVSEQESVKFNSGGYVTTADGRTISFNLEFEMTRAFYQQTNLSVRMGDAAKTVDPLVVVFGNGTPTLSQARYAFDLNADGIMNNIAFATGNSGFLAFDKNADGMINDGSELFGPESGNGFLDLAKYDTDKNGWIDEADEVFGQLMLLTLTQDGEKTLFKLGDVGIGAIYLNDISTQFEIKDTDGQYAEMKSSSIFLRENGTVGTIHHIDLSV